MLAPTYDALIARSADPTQTARLRASFRGAGRLRLRQVRASMRTGVLNHNVLGLGGATFSPYPPDMQIGNFASMLERSTQQHMLTDWANRYIEQAIAAGNAAAARETKLLAPMPGELVRALAQLTQVELKGIAAGLVQQVTRAAATALETRLRSTRAMRLLGSRFAATSNRLNALANVTTVKSFNRAKLANYRAAGDTHVGIIPELRSDSARTVRDAPPQEARSISEGLEKEEPEVEALINIATAGDELVCDDCEEASDDGPYTIDEAEGLLPIHPNCRCVYVRWLAQGF